MVSHSLYRELDESIQQTAALLANQVELENDVIAHEWQEGLGTNKALEANDHFQFWDERSGNTTRSPGLHFRDLPRFTGIDGAPLLRNIHLPDGHRARAIGMRIFPFVLPDEIEAMKKRGRVLDPKSMPQVLVVSRDSEPIHHTLERLRLLLGCGSFLTLALGFLVIDCVVRKALRPIDDLANQVRDRTAHRLDEALDLPEQLPVELSGLAQNFDSLLSRLSAVRQRERDFIRHAAHELRTPIAGLRATTDLALSQTRDARSYAGYLETCQKTAEELGELVKRLSALARIGQTANRPELIATDIGQMLEEALEIFTPSLAARDLPVHLDLPPVPLLGKADRTLTRVILNNLIDNAACYGKPGGEVRISARKDTGAVEIRVSNQTAERIENPDRLFEPLFRKNEARDDSGSHLGIGLTLSQEAAAAMEATLTASVPTEGWIEFVLRINEG